MEITGVAPVAIDIDGVREHFEQAEGDMSKIGPFVCTGCIDEQGIQAFIEYNEVDCDCSFCDSQGLPVAQLDEVAAHMRSCIEEEYDDTNEWAVYDHESGYRVEVWDTWDLLTDELQIDLPNDCRLELLREILGRMPEYIWCQRDPYDVTDQEKARYDWAWFSEVVMHRRRFFFENYADSDDDTLSPGDLLEKIFKYADLYELFEFLPAETQLFRARFQQPGEHHTSAEDLGPPPRELATRSNRMSPPGIPMFYACTASETALRETAYKEGAFAVGLFTTRRPALILDLTKAPPIPSLFQPYSESIEFRPREVLGFLNHVADEISRPIDRDDKAHFQYTPTQVVTEFVRSRLMRSDSSIDGIKFNSAVHQNHASYVIFGSQENVLPEPVGSLPWQTDRWLELTSVCEFIVTKEDIEKWKIDIPKRYQDDYHHMLYGNG